MNGADRVSPFIERAGRVASRYVRLPLRPERDRLCKAARPSTSMIQDVLRRPTTRPERAAEWCARQYGMDDDGSGSPDVSGK